MSNVTWLAVTSYQTRIHRDANRASLFFACPPFGVVLSTWAFGDFDPGREKRAKGWEMWVWLLYNSPHFKQPPIYPRQAPGAQRLRKRGFWDIRERDINMTHHLLILLPLLASVWGDADPWVDNDLYYGTVYQVVQDLVGEDDLYIGC